MIPAGLANTLWRRLNINSWNQRTISKSLECARVLTRRVPLPGLGLEESALHRPSTGGLRAACWS